MRVLFLCLVLALGLFNRQIRASPVPSAVPCLALLADPSSTSLNEQHARWTESVAGAIAARLINEARVPGILSVQVSSDRADDWNAWVPHIAANVSDPLSRAWVLDFQDLTNLDDINLMLAIWLEQSVASPSSEAIAKITEFLAAPGFSPAQKFEHLLRILLRQSTGLIFLKHPLALLNWPTEQRTALATLLAQSPALSVALLANDFEARSFRELFETCRQSVFATSDEAVTDVLPRKTESPETGYDLEYSPAARQSLEGYRQSNMSLYRLALKALWQLTLDPFYPNLNSKKLVRGHTVQRKFGDNIWRSIVSVERGGYRVVWRFDSRNGRRLIYVIDVVHHKLME